MTAVASILNCPNTLLTNVLSSHRQNFRQSSVSGKSPTSWHGKSVLRGHVTAGGPAAKTFGVEPHLAGVFAVLTQ